MVRISEDLVRRRAEHNECEISTLEEVSLHQQDIERIEYIDKWCKELKILYLQSNLIPKIENIGRLKKLEYLNLALNNVERIENLEACESLTKLDLTVNFVGELSSIACLKDLEHLRELYLTGNPCAEFDGYRQFTIATLTRLKSLDGTEIDKSERILAIQEYETVKKKILVQQAEYRRKRAQQIEDDRIRKERKTNRGQKQAGFDGRWYTDINNEDSRTQGDIAQTEIAGDDKEFWDEKVPFTPESRLDVHEHMEEQRRRTEAKDNTAPKIPRRLTNDDGDPLNINEAKMEFSFLDDEENNSYILDLAYYKHMDTSLLDIDVQTNYVRVIAKQKIFQLRLHRDIKPDSSTAKRSQVTGHLLVTMPKADSNLKQPQKTIKQPPNKAHENRNIHKRSGEEKLEVDPSANKSVDYKNIINNKAENASRPIVARPWNVQLKDKPNSEDFIDDPDVPPLI